MNEEKPLLDLDNWMKEIKEKVKRLEKEINDGWKIERSGFFVSIPTPKRFLECKEKDWEVARLYGMLKAIKDIRQRINLAVQGLLEEIEKEIEEHKDILSAVDYIEGLETAKEKIKKWFPDEVKRKW